MTFEVRRVPPDWEHPRDKVGRVLPLFDGLERATEGWDLGARMWEKGLILRYGDWISRPSDAYWKEMTYEDWAGGTRPDTKDYLPVFPAGSATHYMCYENITEGTPISPAFASLDELARWLAQAGPETTLGRRATHKQWLDLLHDLAEPEDPSPPASPG